MTHNAKTHCKKPADCRQNPFRAIGRATLVFVVTVLAFLTLAPAAPASKQVVDFIGGQGTEGGRFIERPEGVAINETGAGGVPAGTIYIAEGGSFDFPGARGNRIQRFERDDSGTPADTSDDTYRFVSAWGAGVETGGTNYEICVVAANCRAATATGGNGTLTGNGALSKPSDIAVDQDTGDVYVLDASGRRTFDDNFRINVYSATGSFLRSFGWDVIESGPDDEGTGYEICKAGVDICKAGMSGSGVGQIGAAANGESAAEGIAVSQADGNPATGTVFVAEQFNRRINTYDLDGTSPGAIGSPATFAPAHPIRVAVDSRGIVYVDNLIPNGPGSEDDQFSVERYDTQNANGGGVGFLTSLESPPLPSGRVPVESLAVDPDSDGGGSDVDALYVRLNSGSIIQFGPLNPPGLNAPPITADDVHATSPKLSGPGLAIEQATGRLYAAAFGLSSGFNSPGVYVLDNANPTPPTASLDSLTGVTTHSLTAHATIDPNGLPDTSYHFEYSTDGASWTSIPTVVLGHQEDPQAVQETIDPPPVGLSPNTLYHVRLVYQRRFAAPLTTPELTATTGPAPPVVETVGTPLRGTTSAQIQGRVGPQNSPTDYHFEYGLTDSYGQSTATRSAGSGETFELVAEELTGLEPDTTYHYRIVADNGVGGSPVLGEDMTITTRASEAPLSHGDFSGPPGSDRAYELVSMPDSGGNPIGFTQAISDDGNKFIYGVAGGTPISEAGSFFSIYYAERPVGEHPQGGWQTRLITPPRAVSGGTWKTVYGRGDLTSLVAMNATDFENKNNAYWRLAPNGQPAKLMQPVAPQKAAGWSEIDNVYEAFGVSADGSRVVIRLQGGVLDPAHPAAVAAINLYDISAGGDPQLVSFLPGETLAACGVARRVGSFGTGAQASHWISADGSLVVFPSRGDGPCEGIGAAHSQLYLRDLAAAQTSLISGPPVSGTACDASFLKTTPDAAFFATETRLSAEDNATASCQGSNDVYRYDLAGERLECLTCLTAGLDADVIGDDLSWISVAEDGSRIYFSTETRLLAGAPPSGSLGAYRLDVASGDLAYIAPIANFGESQPTIDLTPDGSVLVFYSDLDALNPLGDGLDNGGKAQYYRYDDTDRSLVCLSCPQDGSPAPNQANNRLTENDYYNNQPNLRSVAGDGETIAFSTSTPLVVADQNTDLGGDPGSGMDVYEWRAGRLFLVTDGLTNWTYEPIVEGVSSSGRDVYFHATAQYTPDALDANIRLYDARIGGGMEFAGDTPPCPLEVCQGTPKGAPDDPLPSSASFSGTGNRAGDAAQRKCRKGERRVRRAGKTRCVKPGKHRKPKRNRTASHDGRAHR